MQKIELHAKTKYSLDNESTIDIKNLILKCVENKEKGVALVDKNTNISFYKAEKILKELNIKDFKLIYGTEITVNHNKKDYQIVLLLKSRTGLKHLNRIISNINYKTLFLDEIIQYKKHFILGLIYESNNYEVELVKYFDYIEVDKNVSKNIINLLKKKSLVIYSNKINALSDEEITAKKILNNYLKKKIEIDNRVYQNTEEILKDIDDQEIVIDNPNKIFNRLEQVELLDDTTYLPINNDFGIDVQVYINLNKKFNNNIPEKILKRVNEELKLIHNFNYDGFINLYKWIINKCKEEQEEYIIYDNINYLYITYILGINHFDPIKLDLNYDIFFSDYPSINIKVSERFEEVLKDYLKNELKLNLLKCKKLSKLSGYNIEQAIDKYEEKNNLHFTMEERIAITNFLDNYPVNNRNVSFKYLVLPENFNKYDITMVETINNEYVISIDYKDIVDKFLTIEIITNNRIDYLNELKNLTCDYLQNNNYKDKLIINSSEYKNYLKEYENFIILDDLYENLIDKNIELPDIFNIINEIRKNKILSKETKNILDTNNIKLKRYHDITFINKGIILEKTRLEYELLYFKNYYQLEYYYTLLKDCLSYDIIEIIAKGYEEVLNKIKNYCNYKYEYYILNIAKELYESNINFKIEQSPLIEDFTFELDKENKQIILVLNKLNTDIKKYLNNKISLIGTRPINGKMPYLSKIIHKLLNDNKSITLFGLDGPDNYYVEYLLNQLTGIERKSIHQYLNPCSNGESEILKLNENELYKGIKYLLKKDINIKDYHSINDSVIENTSTLLDKLVYMLNESYSDVIIIDGLEVISKDEEEILKELNKIDNKKNIIIFTNLKREWEKERKNNIYSFENSEILNKYIDCISILDGNNIHIIKEKIWES